MRRRGWLLCGALCGAAAFLGILLLAAQRLAPRQMATAQIGPRVEIRAGMVPVPGGEFQMGNDYAGPFDQRPRHAVRIGPFWIDRYEVTNEQFAQFVTATHYVTTAERSGRSRVFDPAAKSWNDVQGAYWRRPGGPNSSIIGRETDPVVHVSWHDAMAYARWADKQLPTEAQWEFAARGGLFDADYPWGRTETIGRRYQANYWQGWFPDEDRGVDGFRDLAPVGSFPPNPYAIHDMAGNVWEWCADWYAEDAYQAPQAADPAGPRHGAERVRRGGSWLCAENYSRGIKVSTRASAAPEESSNHCGFRCVRAAPP